MSLPAPRITETRFWMRLRADHRVSGLKAQREISFDRLFRELAEVAAGMRAEAHQVEQVLAAYRREHGLTAEQVRAERRSRPTWPRW